MIQDRKLPNAERQDWERALHGLVFPVAADEVRRSASDHGGLDSEVADVLIRLPRDRYESHDELTGDIRAVYSLMGIAGDALPV